MQAISISTNLFLTQIIICLIKSIFLYKLLGSFDCILV
jgi:hypothetical protein